MSERDAFSIVLKVPTEQAVVIVAAKDRKVNLCRSSSDLNSNSSSRERDDTDFGHDV
jgi:hypothetical protein